MTVEQAVEKLKNSPNHFDVSIPLEGKEKRLVELATLDTFGKTHFLALLEDNQELKVTLRPKRGAVYNIGETFLVSYNPTSKSPTTMSNHPTLGQPQADLMQFILSSKEEKISDQNRIITSLENALKVSEKEVLEMKQKNMELERENKLKDAEFAIERKAWQADKEREDFQKESSGMNGFRHNTEALLSNPAVMKMFEIFMASKSAGQPSLAPHSDIMPKPAVAHFVKNFSDWMNQQDEKTAGNFFNIVAQMSNHPETWSQVRTIIFPQQQQAA